MTHAAESTCSTQKAVDSFRLSVVESFPVVDVRMQCRRRRSSSSSSRL